MEQIEKRNKPLYLKEDAVLKRLPEQIGKVKLSYRHYPGEDLYSDGTIEDELLSIVKEYSAVEYPGVIEKKNSWPVLYHLSALRSNIVDWLPMDKKAKVLEVGSGCGAITEKLAEKAGEVTCVELSAKRSHINAYRNQDKDNITIHVGNFSDIEPELPTDFDYICLIGVFEYANSYISAENPFEAFLKIMLRHLKEEGRMVIAIENKFGLKYWAGCKEDHLGAYFCGLEGYPDGGNARTFSRTGLKRILTSCGVSDYDFYYPYPDYKFPTVIYSDRRLPMPGELTDNMRNFDRDRMVLFNEKYVFDSLIQDGMFEDFSNSYLVLIGKGTDISYVKYSNDRSEEFALRTELRETKQGREIRKIPVSEAALSHIRRMEKSCGLLKQRYEGSGLLVNPCKIVEKEEGCYASFPFEKGVTLEQLLDGCLERDDMEGFYRLFDKYLSLISYKEESGISDYDLIFANILVEGDRFTVIDYEWMADEKISSKEIAFRAVYCYVLEEEKRNKLNLDFIMKKLDITPREAEEYREKEGKFQKRVTGKRRSMGELRAAMGTYSVDPKRLMEEHLQEILDKRIQVYFDTGAGFSEENSRYLPDIYTDETTIETEISFDGNVRALRIDPADRPCAVKLLKLLVNGQRVPLKKKYFISNGRALKNESFVFDHEDPNFTLMVSELPIAGENLLEIKLELSPLSKELARAMAESAGKIIFQ